MSLGGMSFGRGMTLSMGGVRVKASAGGSGAVAFETRRAGGPMPRLSKIPFLRGLFPMGRSPVIVLLLLAALLVDAGAPAIDGLGGGWVDAAGWAVVALAAVVLILRLFLSQDLLKYHGAEHMAINTYESGRELTAGNIANASRTHPRCGTMLAVYMVLLGLPCAAFIPFVSAALFVVVTVSYELYLNAPRIRILKGLSRAGMWLQRVFTTAVPEPRHIELARQCLLKLLEESAPDTKNHA